MGFNKALIIGLLILSMFFVGMTALIFEVSANYDVEIESRYNDTFNAYAESNALVGVVDSTIEGGEVNPDGLGEAVYTNAVVAGKQSRQSAALAQDLINEVPNIINVNSVILGAIMSILFALTAFGFIAMISRRTP